MSRGILATALIAAITFTASPAAATRPVVQDGDIVVTIRSVDCGPNGKTVARIGMEATAGTQVATVNIERTRTGGTRYVSATTEPVVTRVRVGAGRAVSVTVLDVADVLAEVQFSGHPC